jgi:hypothetical protein
MEKVAQQKTPNTEGVDPLVRKNKRLKIFLIIILILLLLSLSFIALIFIAQPKTIDEDTTDTIEQTEVEKDTSYQIAQTTDVSEYTDIVLKDYDNLYVRIFKGFDEGDGLTEEESEYCIPGIVTYSLQSYVDSEETYDVKFEKYGPQMHMKILNLKNVENEDQRDRFYQAVDDIRNKNLEASYLDVGYLDPLRDFLGGEARHEIVKEIEDVNYNNTDKTFAVFALGGYQETPLTYPESDENIGVAFTVFVFATRGNNIIQLESHFPNTAILGIPREDHLSCAEQENDSESYTYNLKCLADLMSSNEYDTQLRAIVNNLTERFELEVPTVEISDIKEGDCDDHIEGCTADVTVEVSDTEYFLEDLWFYNDLNVEGPITNTLDESDPYYALSFSTSICRSVYLFKTDYISDGFSMFGDGMMWNKYFVYEDCGITGNNIELVTGISMLDTETDEITQLLYGSTATGEEGFLDIAYYIDDISGDELSYKECQYTTNELDNCSVETLDLNDFL